jgi:hypothetical protein
LEGREKKCSSKKMQQTQMHNTEKKKKTPNVREMKGL